VNWMNFYRLSVAKHKSHHAHPYFESQLHVPENFSMHDLIMPRFEHWNLTEYEKKKLSLNLRKILLCHDHFLSKDFEKITDQFIKKLHHEKDQVLQFNTHGGGIYLFLSALKQEPMLFQKKEIICHTSEIPLSIFNVPKRKTHLQLIFRPQTQSYLTDFPSLWQESELLSLFELKDYKSQVA
jgi:hypothetical protein